MIEVEGLTKYYGAHAAVKNVSFHIDSGEIVGFLGPNGAGKTTTMRILTCYTPASAGTARVMGMDVAEESLKIREKLGYLPESVPLYDWMTVRGYLSFVAKAKRVPRSRRADEIARVADSVGLSHVMHKFIRSLSKGFKQRVGLAQALMGDPAVLILDEPTIGLDPRQIREIRELIKSFAKNRTVILSTHILPEVSQICNRVIIINRGIIVAEDTPDALTKAHGKTGISVVARGPGNEIGDFLRGLPNVGAVKVLGPFDEGETSLHLEAPADHDVRPMIARAIVEKGWDLLELRQSQATLEDVFIDLVTEEADADATEPTSSTENAQTANPEEVGA